MRTNIIKDIQSSCCISLPFEKYHIFLDTTHFLPKLTAGNFSSHYMWKYGYKQFLLVTRKNAKSKLSCDSGCRIIRRLGSLVTATELLTRKVFFLHYDFQRHGTYQSWDQSSVLGKARNCPGLYLKGAAYRFSGGTIKYHSRPVERWEFKEMQENQKQW